MKINKQGRKELRKTLIEILNEVPEGERVHFDKNLLEELLFEVHGSVKYLVWSGAFLKNVDLSEVSFDGVMWDVRAFDKSVLNYYHQEGIYKIYLSGTNAKIDFSKAAKSDRLDKK